MKAVWRGNEKQKKRIKVPNPAGKAGRPVSPCPLSFTEAVYGLAQAKMAEQESKKPKAKAKKGK
jgi:hypothetical protein